MPVISLQHIHRNFQVGEQQVHALDDINLQIEAGDYLSIMGPSGSGKSTLLNLIGLLDRANDGQYLLNGQDVTALSDAQQAATRNQTMGFVFQAFHLVPRLTAAENVELPLMLAGIAVAERKARVARVMQALHLSDRAEHKPDQLSGGQRQRVAIARATIMQPAVLLADEPTGNLDRKSGMDVMATLESLNDQGITLIMVTHDADMGARAHRQLHMLDGRIHREQRQAG